MWIPETLFSNVANHGATYTLKLSGWMTTTNTADTINITFALGDVGAGGSIPILQSLVDLDISTPLVQRPWEMDIHFSVVEDVGGAAGTGVGDYLVEGGGRFLYASDPNSSGQHGLEGTVLGYPAPGTGAFPSGVGAVVLPASSLTAGNGVRMSVRLAYGTIDAAADFTVNKGSLTLDRYYA